MDGRQSRVRPSQRNYVPNEQIPSSPLVGQRSMANKQIFIKMWSGKTITIEVDPCDNVDQVIAKIENKEHISLKHHSLTYGGRRLDSKRTMADYKVEKESTLHLVMAASLMILQTIKIRSMTGKRMRVEALLTDTIATVKSKICRKYGIHAPAQTLKLLGRELHDNRIVGDCNIQSDHILSLNYAEWPRQS